MPVLSVSSVASCFFLIERSHYLQYVPLAGTWLWACQFDPRARWAPAPSDFIEVKGQLVRPQDIQGTALLTVEGELDDISGSGQTRAAHDLCANIPKDMKQHYTAPKCGHYGIFSGRRWREMIAPRITEFIKAHA